MSDGNKLLKDYIGYRNFTKRLLLMVGLWPIKRPTLFYLFLPYFHICICLLTSFAIMKYVQINFTNVNSVTRGLSIMTSFFSAILKILCLIINRNDMNEVHRHLNSILERIDLKNYHANKVFDNATFFRRLSLVFTILVAITLSVYSITPIVIITSHIIKKIRPIKYYLPFPGKYPWTIKPNGFLWKFHFILESCSAFSCFCITSGVDSLFVLYVFQMISQLRIMSHDILNINENNNNHLIVYKCVKYYEMLINCRNVLQRTFGPVIIWMMGTNAIILCSLIFQFTKLNSIVNLKGILLSAYTTLKGIQTFMYAWIGSSLIAESELYRNKAYESNWLGKKSIMTSIKIILTQKPLTLTACHLASVSVDIFVKILNTTVSYFFLLQTLEE